LLQKFRKDNSFDKAHKLHGRPLSAFKKQCFVCLHEKFSISSKALTFASSFHFCKIVFANNQKFPSAPKLTFLAKSFASAKIGTDLFGQKISQKYEIEHFCLNF
jgi:hypothetical protein